MPNYRRAFKPGGTFFFTVVTHVRRPILSGPDALSLLRHAFRSCRQRMPFGIDAIVVLPDHLHTLWTLPDTDSDFSKRWAIIKRQFTTELLDRRHSTADHAARWQRRRSVWQPRFYEHVVRDELDLRRHLDYVHFNPVKHGYVACPHAWQASSFARCVDHKLYTPDWMCVCDDRPRTAPDLDWTTDLSME